MQEQFEASKLRPLIFPPVQAEIDANEGERRDAAEHRRRILEAARVLFAEQGVEKVSMHQIAQHAEVGQGTLYRRYAHKGLLCTALLNANIHSFEEKLLLYLEQVGESVPALERLYYVLEQLIQFNEDHAPILSAITDAACGERRNNNRGPLYFWLREVVIALLRRASERQEIQTTDIEYAADIVLLPLAIDFYLYQRQLPGFSQERIAAGLKEFLAHGLHAR